jgi:hypothetical protein
MELKRILFDGIEVLFDLLGGRCCEKRNNHDANRREDKCGEKLIDGKDATNLADYQLPKEYHTGTADHTSNRPCTVYALPEK